MKYRNLGKTGLSISEIGFGCGNIGGILFRPPSPVRLQAIKRALEVGINYFDTAPQYGEGQSESNLGQILKELQAQPYVATKVRLSVEGATHWAQDVQDSVANSLKRLQREYVDILLLHNPVCARRGARRDALSVEDVLGAGGILESMENLRSQGKARLLGFTGLGDTEALHSLVRTGRFQIVQCYYNILNPSAAASVPSTFSAQDYQGLMGAAASAGMGVLGMRILAAGALSGATLNEAPERALSPGSESSADVKRGKTLHSLIGREVGSLPELALRYALGNPQLSCLLIGFDRLEHIDQAVAWQEVGSLPQSLLEQIHQVQWQDFRP